MVVTHYRGATIQHRAIELHGLGRHTYSMKFSIGRNYGEVYRFNRNEIWETNSCRESRKGETKWRCVCECGGETYSVTGNLMRGGALSCGCLRRENALLAATKHGMTHSRLHQIWTMMKDRCFNQKSKRYVDYGGRGITVCEEWLGENGFINFYDWAMNNGYMDELSIDRIDNNGNYCPENCRWATIKEQQNNKRNNFLIEHNGETHTLAEWAEITGKNRSTIKSRVKNGWNIEDALFGEKNIKNKSRLTYNGETHSILRWSEITGIGYNALKRRILSGWDIEEAFTVHVSKGNSRRRYNQKRKKEIQMGNSKRIE